MWDGDGFNGSCRRCARLRRRLDAVRAEVPGCLAEPVAPFGDERARLLIVGAAPSIGVATWTGRPYTGDLFGRLLYPMLYEFGFSNRPESLPGGEEPILTGCRLTYAVKCPPLGAVPAVDEVEACGSHLALELAGLPRGGVAVAVGRLAHEAVQMASGRRVDPASFEHGGCTELSAGRWLMAYQPQPGGMEELELRALFLDLSRLLSQGRRGVRPRKLKEKAGRGRGAPPP